MELVTVRVGKNGVTTELIEELRTVLNKHKKVRVKMLKSSLGDADKKNIVDEVKAKTKARKATLRGHTVILEK